jgi:multidrug transporter EmrE-like cation transporter
MEDQTSAIDVKTWILIGIAIVTNVAGNCMLGEGMQQMGATVSISPMDYIPTMLNPWVLAGTTILVLWMLSRLALLSRADLSYVLPVTAIAYILAAIVGHFLLREPVPMIHWAGIAVIAGGVVLVSETPSRTTEVSPAASDGEKAPVC